MSISYTMIDKQGKKFDRMNAACYYEFYKVLSNYQTCLVYCNKVWMKKRELPKGTMYGIRYQWDDFTKEEYEEYVRLLNGMGLKFKMIEEDARFVFEITIADNKNVANKIILNAIRYLCEDPYPVIVKEFLRLAKQKMVGVNNYTKFILAHYVMNIGHGGHTFLPSYTIAVPLSNKEVKEKILDSSKEETVASIIPQGKVPFNKAVDDEELTKKRGYRCYKYIDNRAKLFELFNQYAPLKDLIKEYKAICAKSM